MPNLEFSLSSFLTAPDQGTLSMFGELFNISALDPQFPTLLIAALSLCVLLVLAYYSLSLTWELFWASRQSPLLLDPSTEVVLTTKRMQRQRVQVEMLNNSLSVNRVSGSDTVKEPLRENSKLGIGI